MLRTGRCAVKHASRPGAVEGQRAIAPSLPLPKPIAAGGASRAPPSRTIATMRRALLALPLAPLLALALPACLSGFSEIRIARSDAASADVARLDATVPEDTAPDAPSIPEDALDATSALDVPAPPLDAPEGVDALDVGGGLDVQDAGAAEVDRVDVVTATDAGELADRAEAGGAADAHRDSGPCDPTAPDPCGPGTACMGNRCGRWVYRGVATVDTVDAGVRYSQDAAAIIEVLDLACDAGFGGLACAFRQDVLNAIRDEPCRDDSRSVITRAVSTRASAGAIAQCWICYPDAGAPALGNGSGCRVGLSRVACCAFE